MHSIVYVASDGSGMMWDDVLQYAQYKKAIMIGFVFADWFSQKDFICSDVFLQLQDMFV